MTDETQAATQLKAPRPRYGTYQNAGDCAEIAVRVTAADYNGSDWDGRPFTAVPDWLLAAIKDDRVKPHTRGSTDYAQWDVATTRGTVNAMPGDWIVRRENGALSVVDGEDAYILINCRPDPNAAGKSDREGR